MSEFNGPQPPGVFPGASDRGLRSARPEVSGLQTGTRLQVRVVGMLAERGIQLQPVASSPTGGTGASGSVQRPAPVLVAQLAGPLPEALTTAAGRIANRPVIAEIVRTEPRLEVRLLPLEMTRNASIGAPRGPAAGPPNVAQWLALELRQHLPGARPLAASLQALQTAAGSGAAPGAVTSGSAPAGPVAALLEQLPPPGQLLQGEALRGRIQQSGIWLEAMLGQVARGAPPAGSLSLDLKAQLLRAAEHLRMAPDARAVPAPPTVGTGPAHPAGLAAGLGLAGLIEGMIKRITTLQLQSLQAAVGNDDGPVRWSFELPFRTPQGIESIIGQLQRERGSADTPEGRWTLVLKLDLQDLGPMRVALGWHQERLSVHFTAEHPDTVEELRGATAYLNERLTARDLTVASMSVREGTVDPEPDPPPSTPRGMLDERA